MPVFRYFAYVGGALLVLLLACTALLPKPPVADDTVASGSDVPQIRIHTERKWPERIVLDTNAPMPAPAKVAQSAIPAQQPASADAAAKARLAFAQLPPDEAKRLTGVAKKVEPKPVVKRRVARARVAPQPYYAPYGYQPYGYQPYGYSQRAPSRMLVAQQPRFFW